MNIYDIAREAGVSIATVSRVLNHKDTVRADTRAKVEKVLKRCNYAPSAIAQGMVSKSLHTVAVLTVDIRDSHYARTAYTIEREFGRRGYEVILCNTGGDRAETLRTLQAVAQKQVDGLILVGSIFNTICQGAEMENLLRKMPVVLANGTLALPDAYSVMVDDCRGVEMAVEHLVKTGRRNLYYIKDKSTDSAAAKAKGFLSGMAAAGLDADGHVLETGETLEDGIRAVQQLLAEGIRPDGILCGEDLTAAGVLKALLRHELFFTLAPDKAAIESNINRAMYLADKSLYGYYRDWNEKGFYNRLISGNVNQTVVVDSMSCDFDSYPYRVTTYARQMIIRGSNITERSLVTRCRLQSTVRSDNNPQGFLAEHFEILENRDLRTVER